MSRSLSPFRPAFTVVELALVLTVTALVCIIGLRHLQLYLDRMATRAAAAAAAMTIARAREEALARRAVTSLLIDTVSGSLTVRTRDDPITSRALRATHGVSLSTTRDSIAFDVRGLGYGPANLTLVARRGAAANTVVVSRLGRVRY